MISVDLQTNTQIYALTTKIYFFNARALFAEKSISIDHDGNPVLARDLVKAKRVKNPDLVSVNRHDLGVVSVVVKVLVSRCRGVQHNLARDVLGLNLLEQRGAKPSAVLVRGIGRKDTVEAAVHLPACLVKVVKYDVGRSRGCSSQNMKANVDVGVGGRDPRNSVAKLRVVLFVKGVHRLSAIFIKWAILDGSDGPDLSCGY